MNTILSRALIGILVVGLAGCVSARGSTPGGDQRVLTVEQIQNHGALNAYEAVRALRPLWLQKRGTQSIHLEGEILVYYDNVRLGGLETLRSIATTAVARMEFISGTTAAQRWGAGHTHGVILVVARS